MATIQKGQKVSFLYSSYLSNGKCIDRETKEPARMVAGSTKGNGFAVIVANSLVGMTENETKQLNVPAKFTFGERDESKVFKLPLSGDAFRVGDEIEIEVTLNNQAEILDGVILNLDEEFAYVDTNHPLAGESLLVNIKVLSFQ